MKTHSYLLLVFAFSVFSIACGSKTSNKNENNRGYNHSYYSDDEYDEDDYGENDYSDCGYEDGIYSATVDYFNPETGYSATYTLDVEVEDCQVVQINFPNGGWLDEDYIDAADLDEDGSTTVYGEEGKEYIIQIDE
jgi:major membrane immunogen (membrane-anchored lipoprotein)